MVERAEQFRVAIQEGAEVDRAGPRDEIQEDLGAAVPVDADRHFVGKGANDLRLAEGEMRQFVGTQPRGSGGKYDTLSSAAPSQVSSDSARTASSSINRSMAAAQVIGFRFRLSGSPMARYRVLQCTW